MQVEVPKQTYERLTGQPWSGGRSEAVLTLLKMFHIEEEPGTAGANLRLQECLINWASAEEPRSIIITEESGHLRMSHHPKLSMTQILGMLAWASDSYKQTHVKSSAPPMELLVKMAEAVREAKRGEPANG